MTSELLIRRLGPADASAIVALFRRVYGGTYANDVFYDARALADQMRAGNLCAVGASVSSGQRDDRLIGHMAMTRRPGAVHTELGNTVVDPDARGGGVAWQVGAELNRWCRELGYTGYLHYPTTDHHIMQRRSVRSGFETGLMLGYVPADTDGKVIAPPQRSPETRPREKRLRTAATIVFEPLVADRAASLPASLFLPGYLNGVIERMAGATGLPRSWRPGDDSALPAASRVGIEPPGRRGLSRLTFLTCGTDAGTHIAALETAGSPCRQIDFRMDDPGIEAGVHAARQAGYRFCGWLPGFADTDVFRVQNVDRAVTNTAPQLVNPVARELLRLIGI